MKEKKRCLVPALVTMVLAVLAAAGVKSFAGPCVHEDGSFGPCHWAGQALFGLSIVIAAESVIVLWRKDAGLRRGLYLAMMLTAVLGILMPGTLISLCGMATMRCRALMRPAMMILFALMGVSAAAGIILSGDKKR